MAWLCALLWPLSHFQEESPLSVSSPDSIGTWLHYTCGVGTGRRRRRSGDQITSSPVSPKSLAFTSSIFGSWQQVFTPFNSLPSHKKKNQSRLVFRTSVLKGIEAVSRTSNQQINVKVLPCFPCTQQCCAVQTWRHAGKNVQPSFYFTSSSCVPTYCVFVFNSSRFNLNGSLISIGQTAWINLRLGCLIDLNYILWFIYRFDAHPPFLSAS